MWLIEQLRSVINFIRDHRLLHFVTDTHSLLAMRRCYRCPTGSRYR